MPSEGTIEYALTRVQARHGMRLSEDDWRRLEASRDLGHYLEAVRMSALAGWVVSLDLTRDSHAIERSLRDAWRYYVERVARWHPQVCQPWLAWLAWLPTLSLLAQLARPEPAPLWLLADSVCGPLAAGSPAERSQALQRTALAPLAAAIGAHTSLVSAWRDHWQRLAPASDAQQRPLIATMLATIAQHADALARAADSATAPRQELHSRLARLFRAAAGTPVASVCHLGLVALELERLRGGLIVRQLFGPRTPHTRAA